MTEKQIYKRMNKAYETLYGADDSDEWYGVEDPKIWKFYRPSNSLHVQMVMMDDKTIKVYENGNYVGTAG